MAAAIVNHQMAENELSSDTNESRRVIIHVTFIKIGEISTLKECFEADILMRSKWREPLLDNVKDTEEIDLEQYWNPKLFIDDVIGQASVNHALMVEQSNDGKAYIVERTRVRGSFIEKLELADFPFDVQNLSVTIMSDLPCTQVSLVEDPKEIHKIYKLNFIDEQEWYLYKYIESRKQELIKDQTDPRAKRSALTVMCRAARRPGYFIWNSFSITFLICCLSFTTFAVTPDKPENRLQLSFTLVLTAVAYKFVVNQCLPKVSYLTYLDRYLLASLVELTVVCFWHGAQTCISSAIDNDYIALVVIAAAYVIYTIQFIIKILLFPCRKRREMKRKESQYMSNIEQQADPRKSPKPSPRENWRLLRQTPQLQEVAIDDTEQT